MNWKRMFLVLLILIFATGSVMAEKVITVAISQEPDGWGPMFSMLAGTQVEGAMDVGLLYRDNDWDLHPGTALYRPTVEEGTWIVNEDLERMRVHWKMRDDVYWHDGVKHTIHDYVFGYEVQMDMDIPIVSRAVARRVTYIDVVNDYEAYVYWHELYPFADQSFAGSAALPRHILEGVYRTNKDHFINHRYWTMDFVGRGAYELYDWVPGSHIELKKNPNFVLGEPIVDRIFVRFIEDTETLAVMIRIGDVDVSLQPTIPVDTALALTRVIDPREVHLEFVPGVVWEHIDLNVRDFAPFQDVRVRRALLHSIDREEMVDALFEGVIPVSHTYLAEQHPLFTEAARDVMSIYEYNPQRARELFAEAGFTPDRDGILVNAAGERMELNFRTTAGNAPREMVQQVLAAQWAEVGVKVDIDNRPASVLFDPMHLYRREWPQMVMFAWVSYPTTLPSMWHSDQIPTAENSWSGQNVAGWSNPRADVLVREIEGTMSEARRQELSVELLQLWTEDVPSLPLFFRVDVTAWKTNIEGIKPTGSADSDMWNCWQWDIK